MSYAENTIIGIYGNKGDGKTTLLSFFLYNAYLKRKKEYLFSNYELNFTFNWLNAYELILNWDKFENSIIGIDELHDYVDSRNSSSIQNRLICSWFLQSRHTESDIVFSTQFPDQVDKRIMRIVDIDIICKNINVDIDNDGFMDVFKINILDNRKCTDNTKYFYAQPIFNLFNSKSKINPFFIAKEKQKELIEKLSKMNDDKFKEIDFNDIKTIKKNK